MRYNRASSLRFATFLAPNMLPVYQHIVAHVGRRLHCPTVLCVGTSFADFERGAIDVGFICGLPYVQLTRQHPPPVELLVAPVLRGERYRDRPIYYSDVIVRRESPYQRFLDLRGCTWAYNDPDSHSGYNLTRFTMVQLGETHGFFGRVVQAGFHQEAIRLVASGQVDASAIDSQVLDIELRDHPSLRESLRVIETLGPSTIQPIVAARRLSAEMKDALLEALCAMGDNPDERAALDAGLIARLAPITDAAYDDIRAMVAAAEAVDCLTLR